jgi:hypothetical protein
MCLKRHKPQWSLGGKLIGFESLLVLDILFQATNS